MRGAGRPRILCVDDDLDVLAGLRLTLRKRFQVTLASSGAEGLAAVRREDPFAIVLSDMRMPAMDGVGFLTRIREADPTAVRMLLTGDSDLNAAIHAINDGQIFRFLKKPCASGPLLAACQAAATQHRLLTAERVLLEQTLRGSIKALTHVLSITNPAAFGRAARVRDLVCPLSEKLGAPDRWEIEVSAMLSQIACVTLPQETVEKLYYGRPLSESEQASVDRLPEVTEELLSDIPRIEGIREILSMRESRFDGGGRPDDGPVGDALPLGARLLKLALDFDSLEARRTPEDEIFVKLRAREGAYDPKLLDALEDLLRPVTARTVPKDVNLRGLRPGMILAGDVVTRDGRLLMARGNRISAQTIAHLRNFRSNRIEEPIRVVVPTGIPSSS